MRNETKHPDTPASAVIEAPNDNGKSPYIDLKDRLKRKKSIEDSPPVIETQTESEKETETTGAKAGENKTTETSATFDEFIGKVETELDDKSAEEVAEMLITIGNVGRIVILPMVYNGLVYPGQEGIDIPDIIRRATAIEKSLKADDDLEKELTKTFSLYEMRLWKKYPKLRQALENISYTEAEIKKFASYLAEEIKDVGVAEWISKHKWILYFIYLEISHARNVIGTRVSDIWQKKFDK